MGLVGLYNRSGQGRKKIFNAAQQEKIKQWAAITPKNLGSVREKIRQEWEVVVSKDTIKRILKCLGMRWKRIRTTVGGKPDPQLYKRKKQILNALKKLSDNGAIDLRYLDESGFCLTPYVPYG